MNKKYIYAIGRRKAASARARLFSGGDGTITINKLPAQQYFDGNKELVDRLIKPLTLLEVNTDYNISLVVSGGGKSGQADACRLAIAKALASIADENRATLKKQGLVKRDPREKERKKFGLKGARKREQFSKR